MRISHKHKFVYISIPRTGSNSIGSALDKFSEPIDEHPELIYLNPLRETNGPMIKAHTLKAFFVKKGWDWNEYYKFAFVRNPFDRMVSRYFWELKKSEGDWFLKNPHVKELFKIYVKSVKERCENFNDYIVNFFLNIPVPIQADFIFDRNDKQLVNFIGRFETLQSDFERICETLKLPPIQLPRLKASAKGDYRKYYNLLSKILVSIKCRKDIKLFGYKF
jgi:hypothetical protein